ncbi:indole-3-glycerol phosphate synthase TrpC [Magnetospirillum gryphiswaldense]|uniref:Indole-3-glycerol phosphate synthase n=2 Tax=Magnetospirillum gryphiswaldense TaxID=55518 RepID=V6F1B1_MAGGM|nr:indole-3-glycerol phosphate synthase TrpC [Magnetospirillum gryphiswaldense]AVM73883.1 Indole-3-glycerol phosphate synthase [Magnetospirillum gryphiswaldense MSR-1]AVM77786.1 Indole-3-glycerol phosphate synthase [Magnetospirillum gryphiswaldense]CAM75270.1 Indole-3-glycerol-phosphate synthase [Magnetospirillum gryphiswaldense MSR-1]CDK98086.1 indole-3-glycerol-phosphate synthase (IGPS) [Magnetospirillum gryphiswaldense MSR-1 v2]
MSTGTILDRICDDKRKEVALHKSQRPIQELLRRAQDQAPPRGFAAALDKKVEEIGIGLIAEIKKASPSAGLIRSTFEPAQLARAYARAGAACLSVLTNKFFQGTDAHLGEARSAVDLPVIRKDFVVDPYQIVESRALGADCILLIVSALTDAELSNMEDIALGYGMDVLIEVHDEAELERALKLKSKLIGVNNRDLKIMKTDLGTTERLAPLIPADRQLVCESGIDSPADIKRMINAGAKRFLIGESLMKRPDVEMATKILLAGAKV